MHDDFFIRCIVHHRQIRTKRIHETVDLMRELYHLSPEDIDKSSITWYYALCLDLALDAGLVFETFESCLAYTKKIAGKGKKRKKEKKASESDVALIFYISSNIKIWCLRISRSRRSWTFINVSLGMAASNVRC